MKKLLAALICICMVCSLAACGSSTTSNQTSTATESAQTENQNVEPIVIRFGHIQNEQNAFHLAALQFKEYVEANAPVPTTVEIYPNGELGGERELAEALQLGSVELAIAPGAIASFAPEMAVIGLPCMFSSRDQAYAVLDGSVGEKLAAGLPDKGLRLLSYWENGFRQITNSKHPINTPDDLKGIKIRTPENPVYINTFSAWGANVTAMAWSEVFTSLQMGAIDAQENALSIAVTNSLWEVQDYISLTNHVYEAAHLLMSESFWQSLSPEMQEVIQAGADYARDWERQYLIEKDEEYLDTLTSNGMKANEVDVEAFVAASTPLWDSYRDEYGAYIDEMIEVVNNT